MAEVESAGGATVYRFTEATVRRALDAGRTAAELHELLATRSATPVPQALSYLVDDVARRHGRLRGGEAASFLRSDDEVLISEVLAHPQSGELELRRIAPDRGGVPAAAGRAARRAPRGRLHPGRRGHRRRGARPDRPRPSHLAPAPAGHPIRRSARAGRRRSSPALVSRMRAGDAMAQVRRGTVRPTTGNGSAVELLRAALAERQPVWIGYVDGRGAAGEVVLEPVNVGGGVVEGRDAVDGIAVSGAAAPDHQHRAGRGRPALTGPVSPARPG